MSDSGAMPTPPSDRGPVDAGDLSHAQLAVFAHELRGTLTVISGYSVILRRPLGDAERASALDGIARAVRRADSLCSAALSGNAVVPTNEQLRSSVSLSEIAEQIATDQRGATGRVIVVHADTEGLVIGDGQVLSRTLTNLVSNAAKYSPADHPIEISVLSENTALLGDAVVVEVADRGLGIPAEHRERVLDPFERLDRDAQKPGTGLGLTIVRDMVAAHGGTLTLSDREGGGTVVRIELRSA